MSQFVTEQRDLAKALHAGRTPQRILHTYTPNSCHTETQPSYNHCLADMIPRPCVQ